GTCAKAVPRKRNFAEALSMAGGARIENRRGMNNRLITTVVMCAVTGGVLCRAQEAPANKGQQQPASPATAGIQSTINATVPKPTPPPKPDIEGLKKKAEAGDLV